MAVYEKEIKDEDGKLNYDRVEDIVRRYQSEVMSRTKTVDPTAEEKQIRQFTSRAIQISKGMYLKVDFAGDCDHRRIRPSEGTSTPRSTRSWRQAARMIRTRR